MALCDVIAFCAPPQINFFIINNFSVASSIKKHLIKLVSFDAHLQMTDIVEIIVLEKCDALQTEQRL